MINDILKRLETRTPKILDNYRLYAVNILLEDIDGEYNIVLEKRASTLRMQPDEISLPGGRIEESETALEAALRETEEELLIDSNNLSVIGELDTLVTVFNLIIRPFVTLNNSKQIETFNEDEVNCLIKVPISFFMNSEPTVHESRTYIKVNTDFPFKSIGTGENYKFRQGTYPIYFYEYNDVIIWGITAKIIKNFIDIIKGQLE